MFGVTPKEAIFAFDLGQLSGLLPRLAKIYVIVFGLVGLRLDLRCQLGPVGLDLGLVGIVYASILPYDSKHCFSSGFLGFVGTCYTPRTKPHLLKWAK